MLSVLHNNTELKIGDTIRVHTRVLEGSKLRIQIFEGILMSISGRLENKMIKVRKIGAGGIGVERIWPINAKSIDRVDVKKSAKNIRRSKLYFLRNISNKAVNRI